KPPWPSVIADRGRIPMAPISITVPLGPITTGRVTVVPGGVVPAGGVLVAAGGTGGGPGISVTLSRRMGLPVSALTTRPRMIAVPVGSGGGRRLGSRTGPCPACIGGGGGGGGTCAVTADVITKRSDATGNSGTGASGSLDGWTPLSGRGKRAW